MFVAPGPSVDSATPALPAPHTHTCRHHDTWPGPESVVPRPFCLIRNAHSRRHPLDVSHILCEHSSNCPDSMSPYKVANQTQTSKQLQAIFGCSAAQAAVGMDTRAGFTPGPTHVALRPALGNVCGLRFYCDAPVSRPTVAAIMAAACSWRVTISLIFLLLRRLSTKSRFSSPVQPPTNCVRRPTWSPF